MKAYRADRLAGIEALSLAEAELPVPGPGQLRLAIRAAGLHLADVAALSGQRLPRIDPPFTPGFEAAGTVAALGPEVTAFRLGQSVLCYLPSGALAEAVLAETGLCVALPEGLSFAQGACLPLAYGGALLALRDKARLQAGETLLVLGAGGQAGLAAIEIGKQLGARVIAAAGAAARLETAEAHGADHLVDAAAAPVGEAVRALTEGRGADVVFDPVGGGGFAAALLALAPGARVVSAGFAAGRAPDLNLRALFACDASVIAANLPLAVTLQPALARQALEEVAGWAASGLLRPRIAAQFAFADAQHAFEYLTARRGSGAVVVTLPSAD